MGEWHHPDHYTEAARAFAKSSRAVAIANFLDHGLAEMRAVARTKGYALTVHGSLVRDLDLVAIPWIEEAASVGELIEGLCESVKRLTGWGYKSMKDDKLVLKPHGRVALTIVASMEINIDLSIMPRLAVAPVDAAEEAKSSA